jgi:pimeloyl-ACP methyl ester carboxylesterase
MLHVERFGARGRQAVVLVPALFCGSWQWNREIDSLASRYDVYALTLPGFDGRARDRGGDLMNRAVADISRLIRERALTHPIIVGHSLGGTIAVLFGERDSEAAGGIISVEGGYPIAPTAADRTRRVNASVAGYEHARPSKLDSVLRAQTLRYVITRPEDVDSVAKYASRSDPAAIVDWMRAALSLDLTGQLNAIAVPLVEIVPYDSTIDPYQGYATIGAKRDAYTAWLAHAPHGALVMIDHSRHFVMFDRPREFDRALFEAIAKMARGILRDSRARGG